MESYESFIDELQKNIFEVIGIPRTDMRFAKKGEPGASKGDRLLIAVEKHINSTEVCGVHIRELFEACQAGTSMQKIMRQLSDQISDMKSMGIYESTLSMQNYEKIKSKLFIRLMNVNTYSEKLSDAIYRQVGDIALVLYFKIADNDNSVVSTIIRRDIFNLWQLDEDDVFQAALLNTYFISPPRIFLWNKFLVNPNYDGENFMDINQPYVPSKDQIGNCLSTTIRTNGAVALFLPSVADRIAQLMNSDFYAVFTSVHEVMIHCVHTVSADGLENILNSTIEEATPPEDVLTHKIYKYCKDTQKFQMCN